MTIFEAYFKFGDFPIFFRTRSEAEPPASKASGAEARRGSRCFHGLGALGPWRLLTDFFDVFFSTCCDIDLAIFIYIYIYHIYIQHDFVHGLVHGLWTVYGDIA